MKPIISLVILFVIVGCYRSKDLSSSEANSTEQDTDDIGETDEIPLGTDDSTDRDTIPNITCIPTALEIHPLPVNVMILLDRSTSMGRDELDGITYEDVIDTSISQLVAAEEYASVKFGLAAFPSEECVMEGFIDASKTCFPADTILVPIGREKGVTIASELERMDTCGGTPTAGSLRFLKSYFESALPADLLVGSTTVLLVTNGAPNCSSALNMEECTNTNPKYPVTASEYCLDDVASAEAAKALFLGDTGDGMTATASDTRASFNLMVPTYILGIGEEALLWSDTLNLIANSGGGEPQADGDSSQFFYVPDALTTVTALSEIMARITECTFRIEWDSIPIDNDLKECQNLALNLAADDDETISIPFSIDCSNPNGWRYKKVDSSSRIDTESLEHCDIVELCPQTCDLLRDEIADSVSFLFGCSVIEE